MGHCNEKEMLKIIVNILLLILKLLFHTQDRHIRYLFIVFSN